MYFESVLLLASVAVIVPYFCFSIVNSLMAPPQEELNRKMARGKVSNNSSLVVQKTAAISKLPKVKSVALVNIPKSKSVTAIVPLKPLKK